MRSPRWCFVRILTEVVTRRFGWCDLGQHTGHSAGCSVGVQDPWGCVAVILTKPSTVK